MMKYMLVFVFALSLAACGNAPEPTAAKAPAPVVADAVSTGSSKDMPALSIETFQGQTFTLSEHRGKWVVVNFWATWWAPCLKEIPDFNAYAKSRSDVQFIGLAYKECERADMESFLKLHPIDYPFAILDVYNPPKDFETPRGLPMTVLIAPDGKVAKTFLGPVTTDQFTEIIDAAGTP